MNENDTLCMCCLHKNATTGHGYVLWYIFDLKITDVIINRDDVLGLYRGLATKINSFIDRVIFITADPLFVMTAVKTIGQISVRERKYSPGSQNRVYRVRKNVQTNSRRVCTNRNMSFVPVKLNYN